jgi:4-amino-4-deoxy-L-arabinose transferase-like glycosyltransferase
MSFIDRLLPPVLVAHLKSNKISKKSKTKTAVHHSKAVPASVKHPKIIMPPTPKTTPASSFGYGRLATVIGAFVFAGLSQMQFMSRDVAGSLMRGWFFLVVATVLLVIALWPWKQESHSEATLSPKLEKFLVAGILLLAAFFRIFRLDQMPPGVFIDQGICGNIALQILHEGYRPIFADAILRNPPYLMYQLAAWFMVFKATAANFFLFFGVMSVGLVFFAYWTIKQLSGVRTALIAAYILAVMCWNVNFSRNGFPTIEVPFYMFATMAFLLHGFKTKKRWAFIVSSLFMAGGMYTYQAYKIFPGLLILFGAYEWFVNRERIKANAKNLVLFTGLAVVLMLPFTYITLHNGNNIWREQNYNIVSQIKEQKKLSPLYNMVTRTAKMFNREGDSNERHNLPNQRMLDDITGALFILGLFFSITRLFKREYFFAFVGFGVMCLPCLLSQDPAHANRMLGTTPFIALLAALPLGAAWDRIRLRWGKVGEIIFVVLLLEPLFLMCVQNYNFYFVKQANNNGLWTTGIWAGYSVPETRIGQAIAREGKNFDYLISPRFYNYSSINFLAYDEKNNIKRFSMPEDFAPMKSDGTRGSMFILMHEHEGVLHVLQNLYPNGVVSKEKDLDGNTIVNYFTVPKESILAARGLVGSVDQLASQWPFYPKGLPSGSHRISAHGCVFVDKADRYSFASNQGSLRWHIAGKSILPGTHMDLARGFYAIDVEWTSTGNDANPGLKLVSSASQTIAINDSNTTTLPLNRGLKGTWFRATDLKGIPARTEWNTVINFPHGDDFNAPFDPLSVRWEGTLKAPDTGEYLFSTKTEEFAALTIDGRKVFDWSKAPQGSIHLTAGSHSFKFEYKKQLGPILSLSWKTPSQNTSVVIPMEAFGETHEGF